MGSRGPAPEPPAAKIARGETRPSRVNYETPNLPQRDPRMPRGMSTEAQSIWRTVLRTMKGSGVILEPDAFVLRAFCEVVASYAENVRLLGIGGTLIRGSQGRGLVMNPILRAVRDDRESIRLLARELGLSPAARAGLRIDMSAAMGDMDSVLGPPPRLRVVGGQE